jgi:exodeoxyribonuclease VII small subunit
MAESRKKTLELEKAMSQLEAIVEQLESGDLTLDKSLQQFEKGVRLSRECQTALNKAEQKVQMLIGDELKDIDPEDVASEPD